MCFTWREKVFIKSIVCKAVSMAKIDFDHTKAIDTAGPLSPFRMCACVFFMLVKNFGRLEPHPPPPDENSWIRACSGFLATKLWFYR